MSPDYEIKQLLDALAFAANKKVGPYNMQFACFSCKCTNILVAESSFRAKCLECGEDFVHDDGPCAGAGALLIPPKGPRRTATWKVAAEQHPDRLAHSSLRMTF